MAIVMMTMIHNQLYETAWVHLGTAVGIGLCGGKEIHTEIVDAILCFDKT